MDETKVVIDNALVIGNPAKRRMARIISKADYENQDTAKMGYLFGLLDVDLGQQNAKIFDIINEGLDRYYKNSAEYDVAFDDLINFLNREALRAFDGKNIKEKCNIALGVQKDSNVLFCAAGGISAYLIYSQDVKKVFPESNETIDINNKLFSYSLSGEVLKNYALYFCNPDFSSLVNPYYLQKAAAANGPRKTVGAVKDYLLQIETNKNCSAVFVYYDSSEKDGSLPAASIAALFRNEQKVAENLSPSLINSVSRALKERPFLAQIFKYIAAGLKKTFHAIKKVVFFAAFLLFNFFFIITNVRGKRKEKQTAVNTRFKRIGFKIFDLYRSLTAISKIILVSLTALMLILSGAIAYNIRLEKLKDLKIGYKARFDAAEKLFNDADMDIILQQKNSAAKKLKDAKKELAVVPAAIRDDSYNELLNNIKNTLFKVQNISEINSPVLIADFSSEKSPQIFPPIYLYNGNVNILSSDSLLTADIKNQTIKKTALNIKGAPSGQVYYYPSAKPALLSIENSNLVQEVDPQALSSNLKEIILNPNEAIKKFSIYNDSLYALSLVDKHFSIWKHNPSLAGFGKPTLWATDNPPEGATPASFAVDSNLYLLFSNNEIFKYFQGRKIDWKYNADGVAGDDVNYFKIITDENHKYAYLLDKKRISVISKDGEFLAHYILPPASDIRDAAIDEASKTIYILDGQKIYAFSYTL